MPTVATRRPHTKSRLGCLQCKARKVKCDQAAPVCSACVRRKEVCSFTEQPARVNCGAPKVAILPSIPKSSRTALSPASSDTSFHACNSSTVDLELTHFYATRTWNTLMLRPQAAALWKDTLFEVALENPVFLNALLATAAMHKLILNPESPNRAAYSEVIKHKGAPLISFILSILRAPSEESCALLFAGSILFTIWAFASVDLPPDSNLFAMPSFTANAPSPLDLGHTLNRSNMPRLDNLLSAINISLGSRSVGRDMAPMVKDPVFSQLCAAPADYELLPPVPPDIRLALDLLDVHWKATSPSPQHKATYELHMCRLNELFRIQQAPEWHDMIVGFAIRFTKDMICLLVQRDPCALVILAYWTAVLRVVEDACWWLKAWPEQLYAEIEGSLEAEWNTHLRVLSRFLA